MRALRYVSVCSGIEAATVAWSPLGWKAVAFAEIEKFPSAVLAWHYPDVPNLGDMTRIDGADFRGKIDVLVGGTPCQSFSVAGLRRGLEDERGNLALEFVRLADECDPAFVVWENVPGVLTDRGNAFGCFLAALAGEDAPLLPPGGKWSGAGYVLGPRRAIAWRVLDAQYFGLAQRRRRVFLVACPRDGADSRKILFEFDGMRRDFAPGREAGTGLAGTVKGGSGSRGWQLGAEEAAAGHLQLNHWEGGPHPCLNQSAKGSGGIGMSNQEIFSQQGAGLVPHKYVPEIVSQAISRKWSKGTSGPAGDEHHNLLTSPGSGGRTHSRQILDVRSSVRRLTPRECERLQGFPDDYTAIPYRRPFGNLPKFILERSYQRYLRRMARQGKEPLQLDDLIQCADGPRYKALGNSMAVPVMRWIGERIERYGV